MKSVCYVLVHGSLSYERDVVSSISEHIIPLERALLVKHVTRWDRIVNEGSEILLTPTMMV